MRKNEQQTSNSVCLKILMIELGSKVSMNKGFSRDSAINLLQKFNFRLDLLVSHLQITGSKIFIKGTEEIT
jgi:hypothetical protein